MPTGVIGTGLTGLVGSRIIELNQDVNFTNISIESGVSILDLAALEKVFSDHPESKVVLHLAAFTDVNAAWAQKDDQNGLCYQLNVVGTQNVIDLCRKYGKYLIHISTDYVFDGTKDGKYTEDDPTSPIEWYGETKAIAEKLVTESGISASIVRLAFPYRAQYDPKIDVVRKIKAKLENHEAANLFDDQFTTPTFIDDIAVGLKTFIGTQPTGIFNLVASSSQSIYEMGLLIAEVFSLDKEFVKVFSLAEYLKTPNARPYAKSNILSNVKVAALGIKMRTLREGLEEMKKQLS